MEPIKRLLQDRIAARIEPNKAIRNRSNYQVEKLATNYFRFTYVFTDDNLADLIK